MRQCTRVPGVARTQVFGYVTAMVHPVQSVIESLYSAGRCPRLHVNASHDDVICPDFIREQWKERLIIDLDASYPLDLTFGDKGLAADLSFGGYVTRCEFPWEAIYIVADRATGRGIVLDRNMPESVRAMFQKSRSESAKPKGPELHSVSDADRSDNPAPVQVLSKAPTLQEAPAAQEVENQDPSQDQDQDQDQRHGAPKEAAAGKDKGASTAAPAVDGEPSAAASDAIARPSKTANKPGRSDVSASDAEPKTGAGAGAGIGIGINTGAEGKPASAESEVAKDSDEKQVLRRRAAFRVIDGGG